MRLPHLLSALFLAGVAVLFTLPVSAQNFGATYGGATINGVPPSVTSFGFGGRPGFNGVPPSVTSLNFGNVPQRVTPAFGFGHHHHRNFGNNTFVNPYYGATYYVPYAYPVYVMDPAVYGSMGQDYNPPLESDRVGPDVHEQVRRELDNLKSTVEDFRSELRQDEEQQQQVQAAAPEPEEPPANQPKTVLVFKDGHQLEVANYAIIGTTLFDLADGLTKKVSLAQLDLAATVKQNDARGLNFQLPAGVKLN